MKGAIPEHPHATLRSPNVVPLMRPSPSPSGSPDPIGGLRPPPSMAPDDYGDDITTGRSMRVAIASPPNASVPARALLRVLAGLHAGQIFTLERDETVIGRGRDADVRVDDRGISRRHARIVRTEGWRYILEDLGSTNGVFVAGRRVERVDLADGDRVQVGPALVLRFGIIAADEEALARELYEGSTRDALTRLYNRKYADERLAAEVAYAHRHGTPFSLVLCDLDHFKRVNDSFGHQAGDVVLRVVAAQSQKAVRTEDILARYGGEEFVVLVRGIGHESVCILANRVRTAVERLSIPWESQTIKVTVSVGVASLSEYGSKATVEALVALADERLYQAKAGGRNRVC
jgi:two-component system cell cycle response regulator